MPFRPAAEYEVWPADIGSISIERESASAEDDYIQGAPEIVAEVLSPYNSMVEINDKKRVCLENGCISFWVVDPEGKTVEVTEGKLTTSYGLSEAIPCPLLGGDVPARSNFVDL